MESLSWDEILPSGDLQLLERYINSRLQHQDLRHILGEALAVACGNHCHAAAMYLLTEKRVDPNWSPQYEKYGYGAPLEIAVRHCRGTEDAAIVKALLECGAKLSLNDKLGYMVFISVPMEYPQVADVLLECASATDLRAALDAKDDQGMDALLWSLGLFDDSWLSERLIQKGANIYSAYVGSKNFSAGTTTLMLAVLRDHLSVVKMLLQRDSSMMLAKDSNGLNVWHRLASDYKPKWGSAMIEFLLDHDLRYGNTGVDDVDDEGWTCFHYSAYCRTASTLASTKISTLAKGLVRNHRRSADLAAFRYQHTPLHLAALNDKADLVQALLENGARVHSGSQDRGDGNITPLHMASCAGADAVAELLLANNANVNARTDENMTPLHMAACYGRLSTVRLLLTHMEQPPHVDVTCEGDWTPLHLACSGGLPSPFDSLGMIEKNTYGDHDGVVKHLLAVGADVKKISRSSKTVLHLAAASGHGDVVQTLLNHKKDVYISAKDNQGTTPLLYAAELNNQGRQIIADMLAPWSQQVLNLIPQPVKDGAKTFDANILDFKNSGDLDEEPQRHRVSVYDLLYSTCGKEGRVGQGQVSTKPPPGYFRWIHLPANNSSWCYALFAKWFIERDCSQASMLKTLERSLHQQLYRGVTTHSVHMRTTFKATSTLKSSDYFYLYAPFLDFDPRYVIPVNDNVTSQNQRTSGRPNTSTSEAAKINFNSASRIDTAQEANRETRLFQAYQDWVPEEHCHHFRRTLDQFWEHIHNMELEIGALTHRDLRNSSYIECRMGCRCS